MGVVSKFGAMPELRLDLLFPQRWYKGTDFGFSGGHLSGVGAGFTIN